jgi:hypothetical protein
MANSATSITVKQIFLQQLDNFINELCTIFPKSSDILLFRERYSLIKSANSKIILDYFIKYIYPHKQKILDKDESFFLEGGGQDEIKDGSNLQFRDNLKKLWVAELSDQNKEIIHKYFKVFIVLCDKYIFENI